MDGRDPGCRHGHVVVITADAAPPQHHMWRQHTLLIARSAEVVSLCNLLRTPHRFKVHSRCNVVLDKRITRKCSFSQI